MNQVILNGIELSDLLELFKGVLKQEVKVLTEHLQPPTNQPEKLLSRKETASLLGVSLVTLGAWVKVGKIPSIKIGTRVRFDKDEVLKAIKG